MSTVRLVSYNVRAFKDDTAALVRVVRALRPDVLCLQEVPRHPFSGHRVAAFARECGLLWAGGERHRMSTTLLTGMRLDVLAAGHGSLPVVRPQEPRGWAWAHLRLPGHVPFAAASVHLSLRSAERPEHARLLRAAPELTTGAPLVLAGDVNEERGGRAWSLLQDGLVEAGGDTLTFPSAGPVKRIDAVFASGELTPAPVAPSVERTVLVRASDHLPLVVDLTLPRAGG